MQPKLAIIFLLILGSFVDSRVKEEDAADPFVTDLVYMDVEIDGKPIGRIVYGMFGEVTPITTTNFIGLATHEAGYGYKGSTFFKSSWKGYSILGGHFQIGNKTYGQSFYGNEFDDENHILKHYGPGWVSTNNRAPNTNGAGFQIMVNEHDGFYEWWDTHYVVFGVVLEGMKIVYEISRLEMDKLYRVFLSDVVVVDSGILPLKKKFQVPKKPMRIKNNRKWEL